MTYYAGWDGGGTGTTIVCISENGACLLRAKAGPLNANGGGAGAVAATVAEALGHMRSLPGGLSACGGLCVGGAGISGETRAALAAAMSAEGGVPYTLAADFETALYAAHGGKPGMALIAGTGAVCCGMGESGETHRCGGWGHIFDDGGSGYAIGRDTLAAVAQAADGRGEPTALTEAVNGFWGVRDVPEMVNKAYAHQTAKRDIAALAALCCDAAALGDQAALSIIRRAADELMRLIAATARALALERGRLSLMGGLMQTGTPLRLALDERLKGGGPDVRPPMTDAANGAALMALRGSGLPLVSQP